MSLNRQHDEHSDQCLVHRQVHKYDGQSIWINDVEVYEIGNYLGGGASGSVYQATDLNILPTERQVAIKILNPVGFKLFPVNQMNKCDVLRKGLPLSLEQHQAKATMMEDNIWWLYHPSSHQVFAAYEDLRTGQLRELTLPKCVEVWGWNPFGEKRDNQLSSDEEEKHNISSGSYTVSGVSKPIPRVAPKFLKWLRSRHSICREMGSMMQIGEHRNIIKLFEILELIQDSKTTLFLVLELVTGGEMFERMKAGQGNSEATGRKYFKQLLSGIEYCHERGVCHRDLKPENLLLSDSSDNAILKIADFGLSAVIFAAVATENSVLAASQSASEKSNNELSDERETIPLEDLDLAGAPVKRLRSVVGSPHYVAPEITDGTSSGYDGRKVDMWSAGVILYGLLTGSLPFGRDLSACPRFKRFKKWIFTDYADALQVGKDPCYPSFFFPFHISPLARSLIVQLLHPDPTLRLSSTEAVKHRWLIHSTPLQRANPRVGEENMHQGPISRQPSPNSSKVSGKPPLPSSRQTSPSQIANLLAYESVKQDSSIFIPTLSRDSSKNEPSSAPGSKISLRHHSPEYALSRPDLESGEVTDDSGPFPCSSPSAAVSVSALNMATLSLNSSIDPQQVVVVCVEDDGDCCVLDDSIWREMDDSATAVSPHSETAPSPAICFSQSHSLHCSQNSLI